jgi:hypothetical protein
MISLVAFAVAVLTVCPGSVFPQEKVTVRVLNISALKHRVELNDERLLEFAGDAVEDSSRHYPQLETVILENGDETAIYTPDVSIGPGLIDVSGALDTEGGFNFTSISVRTLPGKSDLAVIGFDGTVRRFDEEVIIEYDDRSITTSRPILVLPGDTVFLFVRETREMYTEEVIPHQGCG